MKSLLIYLEVISISAAAIFAPLKNIIIVTYVMVFIDLIIGVLAAYKRGEKITSSGFRRTISKIVVYEVALCIGFVAETWLIPDLPITKMLSGMIAVVELKSIFENLDSISKSELLKTIIDKLGSNNQDKGI